MKKRQPNRPPDHLFKSKSCTGKKKYKTEREAAFMIDVQKEYGKDMNGVHPCRCEFCDKWHIGHEMKE